MRLPLTMRLLFVLAGLTLAACGCWIRWRVEQQTSGTLAQTMLALSAAQRQSAEAWRLAGAGALAGGALLTGIGLLAPARRRQRR